jgi:GNAT superfamily N-acetyltransferase
MMPALATAPQTGSTMNHDTVSISISHDDPESAERIEAELLRSLRQTASQAENTGFVLSAKSPDGLLVGGLTAGTSYGWLLVKTLWVAASLRGGGVGQSLMNQAEDRARATLCHGAWLDTSSPDAMRFYLKLGYEPFGRLSNAQGQHPEGHKRWFMKKAL